MGGDHGMEDFEFPQDLDKAYSEIMRFFNKKNEEVFEGNQKKDASDVVVQYLSLTEPYREQVVSMLKIEVPKVNVEYARENADLRAEVIALQQKLSAMEKAILLAENKPSEKKFDI